MSRARDLIKVLLALTVEGSAGFFRAEWLRVLVCLGSIGAWHLEGPRCIQATQLTS